MKNLLANIHIRLIKLMYGEQGQDLVEFALLVSMVAAVVTIGAHSEATAVSKVFSGLKKDFKKF